jgi:hypothetical protein
MKKGCTTWKMLRNIVVASTEKRSKCTCTAILTWLINKKVILHLKASDPEWAIVPWMGRCIQFPRS